MTALGPGVRLLPVAAPSPALGGLGKASRSGAAAPTARGREGTRASSSPWRQRAGGRGQGPGTFLRVRPGGDPASLTCPSLGRCRIAAQRFPEWALRAS